MKRYIFYAILIMFALFSITKAQSVTIMIDPAAQNSPKAGETITINVKIGEIGDLFGYQFKLGFDNTSVQVSKIEEGDFLKSDGASVIAFVYLKDQMVYFKDITPDTLNTINSEGELTAAGLRLGSNTGVKGLGTLVKITFAVKEAKANVLELSEVKISDSSAALVSPLDLKNGVIEHQACLKGDVNNDGLIDSRDAALVLRIAAGLRVPNEYEKCAADIVEDGVINSRDAALILRKSAGLAAPGIEILASLGGQLNVSLAEVFGVAGESLTVPIQIENNYNVGGGDISINYDPKILRAVEVSPNTDTMMMSNVSEPGIIKIAFAGSEGLKSKTLANIKFDVLADEISSLTFSKVELFTPDIQSLTHKAFDGKFHSWAIPPERSALLQNFPNPFNPETWMPYQLKSAGEVNIKIYSASGEVIRELDLGHKSAGLYISKDRAAYWNGKDKFGTSVSSGVYFYSIKSGDFAAVRKLIVLK